MFRSPAHIVIIEELAEVLGKIPATPPPFDPKETGKLEILLLLLPKIQMGEEEHVATLDGLRVIRNSLVKKHYGRVFLDELIQTLIRIKCHDKE